MASSAQPSSEVAATACSRACAQPFVLAISGKDDDYCGWARALHKEAGAQDGCVHVTPGETTVVELRLAIGPPVVIE